jgi:DNA-directed RNA polymerase subunit alpha
MNLVKKGFQLPQKINFVENTLTPFYGKLVAEPLERGFGTTMGNALRRILLSSMEGAAVTSVRIPGVLHEFSQGIKGVKEDVVDILLNIKKLRFKLLTENEKTVTISASGPKTITGDDVQVSAGIEVINKDQYIANIEKNSSIEIEMHVKKGKGYVSAELNKEEDASVDTLFVDSIFSPVKKVNFFVEKTRVGKLTDYDRLIMEIWTDGSISPEKAVSDAALIMTEYLELFIFCDESGGEENIQEMHTNIPPKNMNDLLMKTIEELELSVRAYNCLKNANIKTISDLVQKSEYELLRTKNFGKKSLNEIMNLMNSFGLHLGMRLSSNEMQESQ